MPTEFASQALSNLRDPSLFQWYVIPLFAFVVYVYAVEVERKNWNLVFAGLAFWGMDWFNEIWNSERAKEIRAQVKQCPKNCWMIGSASPVMKKYAVKLLPWIITQKIKSMLGKRICTKTFPDYGF